MLRGEVESLVLVKCVFFWMDPFCLSDSNDSELLNTKWVSVSEKSQGFLAASLICEKVISCEEKLFSVSETSHPVWLALLPLHLLLFPPFIPTSFMFWLLLSMLDLCFSVTVYLWHFSAFLSPTCTIMIKIQVHTILETTFSTWFYKVMVLNLLSLLSPLFITPSVF